MSLAKASVWTASSTLVKIIAGLLVVKLLAVSFGPEGIGQAGNFRQLITVLGVLAGAGIFWFTNPAQSAQHRTVSAAAGATSCRNRYGIEHGDRFFHAGGAGVLAGGGAD